MPWFPVFPVTLFDVRVGYGPFFGVYYVQPYYCYEDSGDGDVSCPRISASDADKTRLCDMSESHLMGRCYRGIRVYSIFRM